MLQQTGAWFGLEQKQIREKPRPLKANKTKTDNKWETKEDARTRKGNQQQTQKTNT